MQTRGLIATASILGLLAMSAFGTIASGTRAFALETVSSKLGEAKSAGANRPDTATNGQQPLEPVSRRFAALETKETPSFRRHVVPLLGKLGCNGRACHGSFQGRGGFRLSLFGYDFKMDHESLLAGDEPRVNPRDPDASLILQKPTLRIPHEGGQRYRLGSWEHHVLLRWIQGGAAPVKNSDPQFAGLAVTPSELRFAKKGEHVALKVVARWSDGTNEDVTPLCRYQTNDEQVAKIDAAGLVTSGEPGDSHVVVFYDSGVVPVAVMRPVSEVVGPRYPDVPAPTEVDRLVVKKLQKLGIVPSEVCSDAEFLRRVSLDVTGTLPTAKEVAAFLADKTPDKRGRKVDELLARPTYAAWWTTRLCDITGNNDGALANITPVDQRASQEWYDWLLKRVSANVPYDKIVEGIVLATSHPANESYNDYAEEMTDLYRKDSERHHVEHQYADRPGLTHYWARRTIVQPEQKALSFAYTFLGIRIQCAECHKHPFDQWTQDDYKDFTKFFVPIRYGVDPADRPQYDAILASTGVDTKRGGDLRRELPRLLAEGKTLPFDEVYVEPLRARSPVKALRPRPHQATAAKSAVATKNSGRRSSFSVQPSALKAKPGVAESRQPVVARRPQNGPRLARKRRGGPAPDLRPARLLGAESVDLSRYDDSRVPLMNWLRSKQNRFFARAFVNRVWAAYFNVGIVNPPDDLSLSNPPSNAELLDYLADGFVKHRYDMKWLHREIVNSRTYQLSWRPNDTNRLDQRNFSHAVLRRLPAEVAYDAVREATGSDATVAKMLTDWRDRAIGIPGSGRRGRGGSVYALNAFGRSVRQSNCDCDRSNEPSLLQTVFLRNDNEVLAMVGDPRNSWVAQIAGEFLPKSRTGRQAGNHKPSPGSEKPRQPVVAPKPMIASDSTSPAKGTGNSQPNAAPNPIKGIAKTSGNEAAQSAKSNVTAPRNEIRKSEPLRPEQRARLIARLSEQIKQLQAAGKTEQAKRLAVRLDELKRRLASRPGVRMPVVAQRPNLGKNGRATNRAPALAARLKPAQLASEKKVQLVRTAYLRTLSRYPDTQEQSRALSYLDKSDNVFAGLRDLLWALVNTQEFIVNH
jgi:hypothetical protein